MNLRTALARAVLTGSALTAMTLAPSTAALAATPGQLDSGATLGCHVSIVTGISNGLVHTENGNWGGTSTTTSTVKPQDLPGNVTTGTRTSFGKTVSGFISPVR